MHRVTRELADSGILSRTAKVGETAPEEVFLKDLADHGPVVLSFYRGRW